MNKNTKKILIADDDTAILDSMTMILEDAGYTVITTGDGNIIQEVRNNLPDLILLDIWISGIDSRDICKYLKNQEATKHVPLILFSAYRDEKEIALKSGADDFMAKPFEMSLLLSKVKVNITNKHNGS